MGGSAAHFNRQGRPRASPLGAKPHHDGHADKNTNGSAHHNGSGPHDELPVPLAWYRPGSGALQPTPMPPGHRTTRLNDQHGYLELPEGSPLAVGDMVGFGISHPCLTFDKWRQVLVVDPSSEFFRFMKSPAAGRPPH